MKTAATKAILLLLAVIFLSAGIIARNKSISIKPSARNGVWEGKLGMLLNAPDEYFGIVLEPDGDLKRINSKGTVIATGKWTITANRFNGSYAFSGGSGKVKISGVVNAPAKIISGTWNNDGDNTGTWKVTQSQF